MSDQKFIHKHLKLDNSTHTVLSLPPHTIIEAPGCKKRLILPHSVPDWIWIFGKSSVCTPGQLLKSPSEKVLFWTDECKIVQEKEVKESRAGCWIIFVAAMISLGVYVFSLQTEHFAFAFLGCPFVFIFLLFILGLINAIFFSTASSYAESPTQEDYFLALNSPLANTKAKQLYLRIGIWWLGYPVDNGTGTKSSFQLENISKLLEILSVYDTGQRLIKAEILRELSRFDEAVDLLRNVRTPHLGSLIRKLAEARIATRYEILPPPYTGPLPMV